MRSLVVAVILAAAIAAPAEAARGRGAGSGGFTTGGFTTGGFTRGGFTTGGFSSGGGRTTNVSVFNRVVTSTSQSGGLTTVTTTRRQNVFVDGGSRSVLVVGRVTTNSAGAVVSTSRHVTTFNGLQRQARIAPREIVLSPNPSVVVVSPGNVVVVSRASVNGAANPVVVAVPPQPVEGAAIGIVSSATLR